MTVPRLTKVSFVIPAHNEELLLGECLQSIRKAAASNSLSYEIIVVDDSSTDRTKALALEMGAAVLSVEYRQIAATRNAGARLASGDVLFFVDADTFIDDRIVADGLKVIEEGKSGGCVPKFEGSLPFWFHVVYPLFTLLVRLFRQPGGSCLFCTREVFEETGGFSEQHFAAEDALFISALKKRTGFRVLRQPVTTSGRKFRSFSCWSFLGLVIRLAIFGPNGFRKREGLEMWYGSRQ